mmetsp:Transcript_70833/g.183875  ORF Transcript_70833/g.183875 Transcript_70833/m.183875 type:complete len:353 (+) Transcript_70833:98-1156(+)
MMISRYVYLCSALLHQVHGLPHVALQEDDGAKSCKLHPEADPMALMQTKVHVQKATEIDADLEHQPETEGAALAEQGSRSAVADSSTPQSSSQVVASQASQVAAHDASEGGFNGMLCVFVRTDTASDNDDYRARAAAIAETWASEPAAGSQVFYLVDDTEEPHRLPASVLKEQIIKTNRANYNHISGRTQSTLIQLNAKPLLDKCSWFAVVDDDTYVNTASIVANVSPLDASELHYIGAKSNVQVPGADLDYMMRMNFIMMSSAAVPLVAEVAAQCDLRATNPWDDYELGRCLRHSNFKKTRTVHPATLQQTLESVRRAGTSLACLDFLHKMPPGDMRALHEHLRGSPACRR